MCNPTITATTAIWRWLLKWWWLWRKCSSQMKCNQVWWLPSVKYVEVLLLARLLMELVVVLCGCGDDNGENGTLFVSWLYLSLTHAQKVSTFFGWKTEKTRKIRINSLFCLFHHQNVLQRDKHLLPYYRQREKNMGKIIIGVAGPSKQPLFLAFPDCLPEYWVE